MSVTTAKAIIILHDCPATVSSQPSESTIRVLMHDTTRPLLVKPSNMVAKGRNTTTRRFCMKVLLSRVSTTPNAKDTLRYTVHSTGSAHHAWHRVKLLQVYRFKY